MVSGRPLFFDHGLAMKAERRHELQHNELADWVASAVERIRPYSRAITGVVVAAAVILLAYVVLSDRAEKKRSAAWESYYSALQAPSREGIQADLEAVARDHKDAAGGLWAEVALADIKLGEGINSYFSDKTAAEKNLKQAIEHYEAILSAADDSLLLARARFGLARALESAGRLKDARAAYQEVVDAAGTSAYASAAKARLEDLNRDSTQEFYAWFAQQLPVVVPESSLPGTPGERMPFDTNLFGAPGDFKLPGDNILDIPSLGKETTGPLLTPDDKGAADEAKKEGAAKDAATEDDSGADEKSNNDAKSQSNEDKEGGESQTRSSDETPADTKKE
jgi:tetratricopeptide (TPR) repeat protein